VRIAVQMVDALSVEQRSAALDAVDDVAFASKSSAKIGTVLPVTPVISATRSGKIPVSFARSPRIANRRRAVRRKCPLVGPFHARKRQPMQLAGGALRLAAEAAGSGSCGQGCDGAR